MDLKKSRKLVYFSIIYFIFIIYGSLVPLDYHYIPFDFAVAAFKNTPFLNLGTASRADWVANIILYIPLTFSLAALLTKTSNSILKNITYSLLILITSFSLAFSIEFFQLYFPARTVSQNDLIAECIGSILGLIIWLSCGEAIRRLYSHILQGGKDALLAFATFYTLAYLALCFFPYDFVTSFQELQEKLATGSDAFFISDSCGSFIQCNTRLITESLLALPLGVFISALLKWHRQRLTAIIILGFIFGLIIEGIQLLLITGIAQGASILARIIGLGAGERLYRIISNLDKPITLNWPHLKKYILIATLPYTLLLANLNGWAISKGALNNNIQESFNAINWLPLYYHYYTTEAVALTSLTSIFAMYLPVGIGVWLWKNNTPLSGRHKQKLTAGLYALSLCFIMETGKLFFILKHPDPTNLAISFASAYLSYVVIETIYRWFHQPQISAYQKKNIPLTRSLDNYVPPENKKISEDRLFYSQPQGNLLEKSGAIIIFAFLIWKVATYPSLSIILAITLLVYGYMLRKYPQLWLVVLPALLPIADLSPWTGRIFFTEFDYFITLSIAITLWYSRWKSPVQSIKLSALLIFGSYSLFYLISLLNGLIPLATININTFSNYYSQYNSLRVGKGLIWAILLLPMLAYNFQQKQNIKRYVSYGLLSGLTAVGLFAIWERYSFVGLFDYSSDFRITSTFYSMHTGGAHLDEFLLLSMPFIAILLTESKKQLLKRYLVAALFSISLYTLLVTYTRATYIAFVITFITLMLSLYFCHKQHNTRVLLWLFPILICVISLITFPVLKGSFIQERFSQTNQEVNIRSDHWLNSIDMMDSDIFTTLFGMGIGTFPRTYLWKNINSTSPATFQVKQEKNVTYLQLGSGTPVYIEQHIKLAINTQYQINIHYRTHSIQTSPNLAICEKAVQHSFNCLQLKLISSKKQGDWQHNELTFSTEKNEKWLNDKPIKLTLHNSQNNTVIDIKSISVTSAKNINLLKNGTFSQGMDHWFFTSDSHIPWRTENMWVQILFDQGWLGLIMFIVLTLHLVIHLIKCTLKQDYFSAIALSAFTGFMVISITDSPFDMPMISLLFFILYFLSMFNHEKNLIKSP